MPSGAVVVAVPPSAIARVTGSGSSGAKTLPKSDRRMAEAEDVAGEQDEEEVIASQFDIYCAGEISWTISALGIMYSPEISRNMM